MSCQSAPGLHTFLGLLFFEFGQGHRGPMIPYCPGPHELSV
ncbi:unnamed protein product, partial [Staurois parvus]